MAGGCGPSPGGGTPAPPSCGPLGRAQASPKPAIVCGGDQKSVPGDQGPRARRRRPPSPFLEAFFASPSVEVYHTASRPRQAAQSAGLDPVWWVGRLWAFWALGGLRRRASPVKKGAGLQCPGALGAAQSAASKATRSPGTRGSQTTLLRLSSGLVGRICFPPSLSPLSLPAGKREGAWLVVQGVCGPPPKGCAFRAPLWRPPRGMGAPRAAFRRG